MQKDTHQQEGQMPAVHFWGSKYSQLCFFQISLEVENISTLVAYWHAWTIRTYCLQHTWITHRPIRCPTTRRRNMFASRRNTFASRRNMPNWKRTNPFPGNSSVHLSTRLLRADHLVSCRRQKLKPNSIYGRFSFLSKWQRKTWSWFDFCNFQFLPVDLMVCIWPSWQIPALCLCKFHYLKTN